MFDRKRREFITLLGGAATWPLAAQGQQPTKLPTIGYLGASTLSFDTQRVGAFVQRLRELGWIEGRTIAIEYPWSEGRTERYAEIAAEFVRLKVDVIVATGGAIPAAKQATSVIPIVFPVAGDPVGRTMSIAWHDQGAILQLCRSSRRMLPASGSSFCARLSPRFAIWRSWPMSTTLTPCASLARFRQPPAHSGLRRPHLKSGEPRILSPPLRRSRAARMRSMCG
jgi:ABC transporter substrate binding protein